MSRPGAVRQVVLAAGLLLTLGLSAWTYWRQQRMPEVVPAAASAAGRPGLEAPAAGSQAQANDGAGPRRLPDASLGAVDPFAVRSWLPPPAPPPPPPPQPPAPEPTAPPLPFQYMGRQEQAGAEGRTVIFLTRGGEVHAVAAGQELGSEYRFDGLQEGVLRFTYLPLSVSQELNIGTNP